MELINKMIKKEETKKIIDQGILDNVKYESIDEINILKIINYYKKICINRQSSSLDR